MEFLDDLVLEYPNYQESMVDHISEICFQINKLKANYPHEILDELVSKIALLIKHCDTVLVNNEEKTSQLDSSLRESAILSSKLEEEKKQRELEFTRSFQLNEVELEEKIMFKKQITELEERLNSSNRRCNSLLMDNNNLTKDLKNVTLLNDALVEKINAKDTVIAKLTVDYKLLKNEISALECNTSWSKDKWVDDTVLNSYFLAMEEGIDRRDILFLGPSVTLSIRFGTPDSCMEILKLTSYLECRFVFLCLSDCNIAGKEDGGSHWSLIFLDRSNDQAYHFDSMHSMNRHMALIVASNLGVKSDVIEMPCIQQKQTFECGIHVLANAKYIAHHYCANANFMTNISFSDWYSGIVPHSNVINCSLRVPHQESTADKVQHKVNEWEKVNIKNKLHKRKMVSRTLSVITNNRFQTLGEIPSDYVSQDCLNTSVQPGHITNKSTKKDGSKISKYNPLKKSPNPTTISYTQCHGISHKLTVASDSQGRGISVFLNQINDGKFNISNNCKPGAKLKPILQSVKCSSNFKNHSKSDFIVLIAGTNNVLNPVTDTRALYMAYKNYLLNEIDNFIHTNLIFSTIPYRYDQSADSAENKLIKNINIMIRQLTYSRPHVQILDLYLLQSSCHTRHGLHLNGRGKRLISKEILKIAEDFLRCTATISPSVSQSPSCNKIPTSPTPESNILDESSQTMAERLTCPIQVIEAVMMEEIKKYQNSAHVAFSHCISRDFGNQGQMSGGVAATYCERFGRPERSDCLNEYLALQHSDNQAAVYGLITKQVSSGKPTFQDYNSAFQELTEDFHKRKFKMLICPAMGCVRDNIPPKEFADNIVKFHYNTGAVVNVVVTDERASRTLRNGLDHREFVDLLQCFITQELSSAGGPAQQDLHPTQTLETPVAADQRKAYPELDSMPSTCAVGQPVQDPLSPSLQTFSELPTLPCVSAVCVRGGEFSSSGVGHAGEGAELHENVFLDLGA